MNSLRVMLIEDSELDAGLILRQLFLAGYETKSIRIENANELLEALQETWDVIIADFRLPGFDAIEALKMVKNSGVDTPFIIVSGAIGEETAVALMRSGARDYIMKDNLSRLAPVVERELIEAGIRLSQRKAHEALMESERNLRTSQQIAHVGHWIHDINTGQVVWSDEMFRILGVEIPEATVNLFDLWKSMVHLEDRDYVYAFSDFNEPQNLKEEMEYRIVRPDGSIRYVLSRMGVPVQDANGAIVQYSGVIHDITKLKLAELELLRQMEESRRRAKELETITLISSKMRQANTNEELVVAVLEEMSQIFKAEHATVAFFEGEYLCSDFAIHGNKLESEKKRDKVSRQFLSFVKAQKLGFFEKIHPMAFHELPGWLYGYSSPPYSMIAYPITNEAEITGILFLAFMTPRVFDNEQRNLVKTVTEMVGNALKRMSVTAELKSMVKLRERELETIYKATSSATVTLDIQKALANALRITLDTVDATAGAIYLLDENQGVPAQIAGHSKEEAFDQVFGEKGFQDHVRQVIIQGRSVVIPQRGGRISNSQPMRGSFIGLPMRAQNRVNGVLAVLYAKDEEAILEEMTLLSFIADHLALVVENSRLYQKAERSAVMEERSRLARELHDSVTQSLYSANLYSAGARRYFEQKKFAEVDAYLAEIGTITQQALKDMRLLVYELRLPELKQAGLIGAIENRLDAVERRLNIEAEIIAEGMEKLPGQVEENLFRIAIESLNNALKYAQATKLHISFTKKKEKVVFRIKDNGTGFDVEKGISKGGFGLAIMRERAERFGGKVNITSKPGSGTTVEVSFVTKG